MHDLVAHPIQRTRTGATNRYPSAWLVHQEPVLSRALTQRLAQRADALVEIVLFDDGVEHTAAMSRFLSSS